MQTEFDAILEKYHQARQWLLSLITDPTGSRYFQDKSSDVRMQEFIEQIDRIENFLQFAGDPQNQYHSVHVAGTSGKGSVVNMIAAILSATGLKTGFHVSPYLQVCNEKLIVDGEMIPPSEFVDLVDGFRNIYHEWINSGGKYPSLKYGEAWVALTYYWMAKRQVEWAVIETGLGGRYDPTNVLLSQIQVITNVDYDHVESIGPELTDIADHKAGIIKSNGLVVTAEQKPGILSVIQQEVEKKQGYLYCLGEDFNFSVQHQEMDSESVWLSVNTPHSEYTDVRVTMRGNFQPVNAALSIAAVDILANRYHLPVSEQSVRTGLDGLVYPGRMEIIQADPLVILDGAHNSHKMQALVDSLSTLYPDKNITSVIGMLSTKDYRGMIQLLIPISSRWIVTQPHVFGKPSTPPEDIVDFIREMSPRAAIQQFDHVFDALDLVISKSSKKDLIVITGSLYLVGEARERWFPSRDILFGLEQNA
jgi:dihydrofolate synthase/folylpolyglutamate synthase